MNDDINQVEYTEQLTFDGFEHLGCAEKNRIDDIQEISVVEKLTDSQQDKVVTQPEPSLEQWRNLYDVVRKIRQFEPWLTMMETDIVTIVLPEKDEPIFCMALGASGGNFGVVVHPGQDSLSSYNRMSQTRGHAKYTASFEADCLICYFGDREDISSKDRDLFKSIGLRFRGRGEWPKVRDMQPGYHPWYLNSDQVRLMTLVLEKYLLAAQRLENGEIEIDFDDGETLVCKFSSEKDSCLFSIGKIQFPIYEEPELIFLNNDLIEKLSKRPRSRARFEFEVTYLEMIVRNKKGDRPYHPRLVALLDGGSGVVVSQELLSPDDCIEDAVFDMLVTHINKFGRPISISTRSNHTSRYIEDFCNKCCIKLLIGKGVPAVDSLLEGFSRFY